MRGGGMAKGGEVIFWKAKGRRKRGISRWEEEEEEEDEEYIAEEEDESDESEEELELDESDVSFEETEEEEEEEEKEFEFHDESDYEEEEIKIKREKNSRKLSKNRKSRTKSIVSDEDDEIYDVAVVDTKRKARSVRDKEEDLDFDEEFESEDDQDEDFTPEAEEEEDEETPLISGRKIGLKRGGNRKQKPRLTNNRKPKISKQKQEKKSKKTRKSKKRTKKRKKNAPKEPARKRRRRIAQIDDPEEDDDEFIVSDRGRSTKRKLPISMDSDRSEFDYITSDEDLDFISPDPIETKSKKRRKRCCIESSDSDSDFVVCKEREKKREERGKEKELAGDGGGGGGEEWGGKKMCGICLSEEQRRTTRGMLDCCMHFFCFACILEWSKVESRCPVCKRRFASITKSSSSDSDLGFCFPKKVIKIPKRDQVYEPTEEEMRGILDPYENVVCTECHQAVDDGLMLLCDICDSSAHTYCVGLGTSVPDGNWYCDCCRSAEVSPNPNPNPSSSNSVPDMPRVTLIDLNAPPRDLPEEEEPWAPLAPPATGGGGISGGGAATLSGRRAIRQRIRILLSNSRPIVISSAVLPETGGNEAEGAGIPNAEIGMLSPCTYRELGGAHSVEGAKESVRPKVR